MKAARIHPDDLYFAILDAPISRGWNRAQELRYDFESLVPVGMDSLQTVFRTLSDRRVLAIGIPLDQAAELGTRASAATPESFPEWLDLPENSLSPSEINLLTGASTRECVARTRRRTVHTALAFAVILCGICSWGIERRIKSTRTQTESVESEIDTLYQAALGISSTSMTQPPAAMLTAQLRKLRSTRAESRTPAHSTLHADTLLAGILRNWPGDAMLRTDSITISTNTVEIAVLADSTRDTTKLLESLHRIDGLESVRSTSTNLNDETRFEIRMRRTGETP